MGKRRRGEMTKLYDLVHELRHQLGELRGAHNSLRGYMSDLWADTEIGREEIDRIWAMFQNGGDSDNTV